MALQAFEGKDVLSAGVEMPGASGGLNKALAVDELELHHGDQGTIVIEYEVKKVRFDPINDTAGLQRVHVLTVLNAAQVDSDLVAEVLAAQAKRVEEAQGIKRLPFDGDEAADDAADIDAELEEAGV